MRASVLVGCVCVFVGVYECLFVCVVGCLCVWLFVCVFDCLFYCQKRRLIVVLLRGWLFVCVLQRRQECCIAGLLFLLVLLFCLCSCSA